MKHFILTISLLSSLFCISFSATCGGLDCGAASCCIDQQNGAQCYTPTSHTCIMGSQGNKLCGSDEGVCGTYPSQYCYTRAQYDCVSNQLVFKGAGGSSSSSTSTTAKASTGTSSTTGSSTTSKATSSSTTGASTTGYGNNICGGINCGRDSCCVIQSGQGMCYSPNAYSCSNGVLCPAGLEGCGGGCYDPSQYSCVNSQLQPTGRASSTTTSKSSSTGKSSTTSSSTTGGSSNMKEVKLWGLNYSPKRPSGACPSMAELEADLRILATLTTRIRLYSIVDCDQGQMVLRAIKNTGVRLRVTLGVWLDKYYATEFQNERAGLINLINNVGLDLVDDLLVGSETQYRNDFHWTTLVGYMRNFTTVLTSRGFTNIDVATVDIIYTTMGHDILNHENVVYVNQFPFWEGAKFEDSAELLLSTIDRLRRYTGDKQIIIGETGWPTNGSNYQYAVPGETYLSQYLHDLVCEFDRQNLGYFWFEAFDEPYKSTAGGGDKGVEKHWGLYTHERVKKAGVTLPVMCPV